MIPAFIEKVMNGEQSWNDCVVGQQVVLQRDNPRHTKITNNPRLAIYLFGAVSKVERLRNCVMLTFDFRFTADHERVDMVAPSWWPPIGSRGQYRWKRQAEFTLFAWNGIVPRLTYTHKFSSNFKKKAGKRKVYAQYRAEFDLMRSRIDGAFGMLGLTVDCSEDEFKKAKRTTMLEWHPDLEERFVLSGGDRHLFKENSAKMMEALAEVEHTLARRDNTNG